MMRSNVSHCSCIYTLQCDYKLPSAKYAPLEECWRYLQREEVYGVHHSDSQVVISLLLILAGDIEVNPGPGLLTEDHISFFTAAAEGDLKTMKQFIHNKIDVNIVDEEGRTALMIASKEDHVDIVILLLDNGASVDMQDKNGWSALIRASYAGSTDVIKVLLDRNADVNLKNSKKWSALFNACHWRKVEAARLLFEKGAQVDDQNNKGMSPLMDASSQNHIEIVELLLEKKAQVNLQCTKSGKSALIFASDKGYLAVAQVLLQHGAKVDLASSEGNSPLMAASSKGFTELVKLLLENDANVSLLNKNGESALDLARRNKHTEVVDLLLNKGSSEAFFTAATEGDLKTMKQFIHNKIDVNIVDEEGRTALMIASKKDHVDIVILLLDNGASVDTQDKNGRSALINASREGNTDVIKALLEKNAKINLVNYVKWSALFIACHWRNVEAARLLLEKGAEVDLQNDKRMSPLMDASSQNHIEIIELLLEKKAKVNLQSSSSGKSALIFASDGGYREVVELLLQHGAKVDLSDKKGWTALLNACQGGHIEVAKLLLKSGARVDLANSEGYSPLMIASSNGFSKVVRLLLENGAKVDLQNKKGESALYLARQGGHTEVVNLLLLNKVLCKDERIPGVTVIKNQIILEKISGAERKIDCESDAGISINISEGSISPDELVDLLIQPSFSGPFEFPKDMEPASPAYLIKTSKKMELKKPLIVRMQHSAKLQTEEDCKNMVFLRANSIPEYRGSNPVYVFREIEDVRGAFTIKNQFGEIVLTSFGWWRAFIRKGRMNGEILYSARLYWSLSTTAEVSATFCMCPHHTLYMQFCDKTIYEKYSGISKRVHGCTVYNELAITSDAVALTPRDTTKCIMDKSEISKAEIDFPETNYENPSKILDYPPRISITCSTTARSESLTLSVEGLQGCTFMIIPAATAPTKPPSTSFHPSSSDITSDATRKRFFSDLPAKPLTDDGGHESWSQPILYRDERIPGVVLVKDQRILEKISSAGKKIDHESDAGISIDIPEGSISPDESVNLLVQPSFSGSFKIPEDMVPASPAYLIETSKQIVLKKPFTVRMQHSAKLKTEEDCKNIVFLRASSDPEYRGSDPVYVFREVEGARGTFNEGSQFGEVALTHFSWWMAFLRHFGIIRGENLYSARLYKSLKAAAEVSAVFCMCPHHTIYTQFCDKSIPEEYSLSKEAKDRSVYNALAISSDAVALKTHNTTKCIMDKSEISKAEIDYPLINNCEDPSMVPDYPPRISITCTTARSESLTLSTEGLEKDHTFTIIPAARMSGLHACDNEALPIKPKHAISDQTSVEDEANKDEASKDGASKDGASKDGASKDGASKDGASKDGAGNWKIEDKTSLPQDANEVIRFLKENDFPAGKARELGVCLDVPQGRLSTFETNHPNNADRVLMDVINYWIDNKEASWDRLATALEECGHAMMAKKIQRRDNVNNGGKQSARQSLRQQKPDKFEAMDLPGHYTVACSHDDAHTPSS